MKVKRTIYIDEDLDEKLRDLARIERRSITAQASLGVEQMIESSEGADR